MQQTKTVKRDISLRDLLSVLRRQWISVLVVFILCLGAGAVAFKKTMGTWRTSMRIMLTGSVAANGSNESSEKSAVPSSVGSISSQMQVLQSDKIVEYLTKNRYITERVPGSTKILAQQVGDTNVLNVTVEAADPLTPGIVAAQLGDLFGKTLLQIQNGDIDRGIQYLTGRLDRYNIEYKKALWALQNEKAKRTLPALMDEGPLRSGKVSQTEAQVESIETQIAADEKTLAVLEAQQRNLPKSWKGKSIQPNRPEIEAQVGVIEGLKMQRANLATQWKEGALPLVQVDAQIAEAKRRLAELPPVVDTSGVTDDPLRTSLYGQIAGAKAALEASRVRLAKAQGLESKAFSEFQSYGKVEPEQTKLSTEVAEARNHVLEAEQSLDALQLKEVQTPDPIRLLSDASPPEKVRPLMPQYLLVSLLTGFIFAVGLALLKDHLEDRVTSPDEVFQICGMEPLAQMPRMPALTAPFSASTAIERHEPAAELFDSYRLLRFNLLNAAERGYMGSLVITSASGSEGKSELAADLASVMAGSGRKVILVDANLRHPSVARRFGLAERPGMTDVLIGEASLESALVPTSVEGLSVLPAGAKTSNPVDLLESAQMVSMHSNLRELADLVIFDAPSCLSFADVSVLASFTDSVIMVAELGTTKRTMLNRGVNLLQRSSARLVGVVLRENQPKRRAGRRKAAA